MTFRKERCTALFIFPTLYCSAESRLVLGKIDVLVETAFVFNVGSFCECQVVIGPASGSNHLLLASALFLSWFRKCLIVPYEP
jgi:hypothetical protein